MDQSCKLWKAILANQDGIWEIGHIHVGHMTIEILRTDLHDVWIKSVGVRTKNVFSRNRPHGGAITGLSGKFGAEVRPWHPGSVCAEFHTSQGNGAGD